MSRQIIIQPDGLYAVWSSVVDNFVLLDATEDEVIGFFVDDYLESITKRIQQTIEALKAGEKPYFQFTLSWEQAKHIRVLNASRGAMENGDAEET